MKSTETRNDGITAWISEKIPALVFNNNAIISYISVLFIDPYYLQFYNTITILEE